MKLVKLTGPKGDIYINPEHPAIVGVAPGLGGCAIIMESGNLVGVPISTSDMVAALRGVVDEKHKHEREVYTTPPKVVLP